METKNTTITIVTASPNNNSKLPKIIETDSDLHLWLRNCFIQKKMEFLVWKNLLYNFLEFYIFGGINSKIVLYCTTKPFH